MNQEQGNDKNGYGRKRDWRNGRSKGHKLPCQRCGGRLHEPGKHFSAGSLLAMQAKAEREQARAAAACGAGQVVQAGQ